MRGLLAASSARPPNSGRQSAFARVLRSTRYFSGIYLPGAFAINPLNYALGLAAAAEAAGARIFEETPALEIDPAGVRKRITTPSARVRAGHVVLAGNVHIGSLMPDLAGTLVPISTYSIVTEPLGERLRDAIRFRGAVTDNERGDNHSPRRRRRPADVVGPLHGLAARPAPLRARAARRHPPHLSAARQGQGRVRLDRHARHHRAPHAADRRDCRPASGC